jgi:UDP-N-acetylmuramoyl-tripeptide--D-alanyl-D-alanine ligase
MTKKVLIDAISGEELFANDQTNKQFSFSSVVTDSRDVQQGSLFVPLVGQNQDGHKYVEQAGKDGASVILVGKSSFSEYKEIYKNLVLIGVYIFAVENTLLALQMMAAAYVRQFPQLKKIAITGSSGKTTTKELIASVLKQKFNVVMTEGNLNSETGLPLSVFKIQKQHEVGVFEMGMNRKGEISELADVLFPNLAVITNIGTAHIGILGTKDAIAQEKKKIFKNFSNECVAFIPNDEYKEYLSKNVPGKIVYYGMGVKNEINKVNTNDITNLQQNAINNVIPQGLNGTDFDLDGITVHFPLPGKYNLHDALAAIAVGKYLGLSTTQIASGIQAIKPLFGRSQVIDGYLTVVQDCYNANLDSMLQSISLCDESVSIGKKVYILGDMLELGEKAAMSHFQVCERVLESEAKLVVLVGEELCSAYKIIIENNKINQLHKNIEVYCIPVLTGDAMKKIKQVLLDFLSKNDFILLKGSRSMRLERFTDVLADICCEKGGNLNV